MGTHLFAGGVHGAAQKIPAREIAEKQAAEKKKRGRGRPPKDAEKAAARRAKREAKEAGLIPAEEAEAEERAQSAEFENRAVSVVFGAARDGIRPNPPITPDEWADKYRLLPSESSAEPGRWETDRTPYLRGILRELDPENPRQEIVVLKGAQVGFSEAMLGWQLCLIDIAPGPMLCVQPTIELAQRFSKQRVAPSIDKCSRLRGKIADKRSRDSSNSLLQKDFTGGTWIIGGANSAVGLRSMPVRNLALDEVDGYPDDCDGEGDPVVLAVRRTATFKRRKILYGSTPKYKATSRISRLYEDSDRREYHVPCPHCGAMQPITWESIEWTPGKPETAHMVCRECGCVIEEAAKTDMLAAGQWVAQNPGHKRAGFHLSSLYSPLGWYSWAEAATDYEAATTDPTKKQAFVNTVLGLAWEEEGEGANPDALEKRVETYPADIPAGGLLLTGSVDVQARRLEVEFVAWGVGRESWSVEYHVLYGDPGVLVSDDPLRPSVWQQLDALLARTWQTEDGRRMALSCTCVDSGGHFTGQVYAYCKAREVRRVFAIKGVGGSGRPLLGKPSRANRARCALFPLGVDTGKELVYSRLRITEKGPGYCHFPAGRGYDKAYFAGLTAEKLVVRQVQGRPRLYWVKEKTNSRNEPLDLRVYATAALELLRVDLDKMAAQVAARRAREAGTPDALTVAEETTAAQHPAAPARRRVISRGVRI